MTYKIEKVANMIFITDDTNQIWKAWNVEDFTERKLENAKKKLAWYWHAEGWVRKSRKEFSLNEIRTMHGSETVKSGEYTKIGVPPVPPTTNHYQEQVLF